MKVIPTHETAQVDTGVGSLDRQIRAIHDRVLETAPGVERIACALYDPDDDLLKTFINSTRQGTALHGYQYRLSDSESLSLLARSHEPRLLTDLENQLDPYANTHSAYVLEQGYRSSLTVPLVHRGEFIGFVFFDSTTATTFSPPVVRELLLHASLVGLAIANEMVAVSSIVGTIQLARDFTQLRDDETGAHVDRMARYSRIMARELSTEFGYTDEDVEHMFLYAPMHDIGKIGIPDRILLKPGPLDRDEWEIMRSHTTKGASMVDSIIRDLELADVPDEAMLRAIVELHHEKLDGSGYPHGLAGDAVPPAARIITVADIFDALTSRRPYKQPWTFDEAFTELRKMVDAGTIDGRCVETLVTCREEIQGIREAYPDE